VLTLCSLGELLCIMLPKMLLLCSVSVACGSVRATYCMKLLFQCMTRTRAYTQGNSQEEKREVHLHLLYNETDEITNFVVSDNGKGMDKKALKVYATFSYSQQARREDGVIESVHEFVFLLYLLMDLNYGYVTPLASWAHTFPSPLSCACASMCLCVHASMRQCVSYMRL
jgi:hypothetical protein